MKLLNRKQKKGTFLTGMTTLALMASAVATADVPTQLGKEATAVLQDTPTMEVAPVSDAKRVYVTDPGAFNVTSQVYTIDGNNGKLLGMLDAGKLPNVMPTLNGDKVVVANTWYDRIARGNRNDYVEVFDAQTHEVVADIDIPEGRFLLMVYQHFANVTPDDKHMLFQQFSPSPAVGLVDLENAKFVKMMDTPDCYHVLPVGDNTFYMHCRDGSLLKVKYDAEGNTEQENTKVFHAEDDYLVNSPAFSKKTGHLAWTATNGMIYQADLSADDAKFEKPFQAFTDAQLKDNWKPGGHQPIAYHNERNEIYLLADQRAQWKHKLPSRYVFVLDGDTGEQLRRIDLGHEVNAIAVSQDAEPYLFGVSQGDSTMYAYDAQSGEELYGVDELGRSPHVIVVPEE